MNLHGIFWVHLDIFYIIIVFQTEMENVKDIRKDCQYGRSSLSKKLLNIVIKTNKRSDKSI